MYPPGPQTRVTQQEPTGLAWENSVMPERTAAVALARLWGLQPLRYLVVGGIAFGFDVGVLFLLHDVVAIPLEPATAVAFVASFAVTYTLQRVFTFRSRAGVPTSTLKYTLLVAANTVAVTGIVSVAAALGVPWFWGKVIAVVAMTVWNYFAYRYWVFAPGSFWPSPGASNGASSS